METHSKRGFLALAILMLVSILISSCGKAVSTASSAGSGESSEGSPGDQGKVTITMWGDITDVSPDTEKTCFQDYLIDPFNAQSETTEVELVLMAQPWETERTALQGGGGPDIVQAPGPSTMGLLAQSGHVVELSDFSTQYGWGDSFAPWALTLGIVDGKLYSLPSQVETLVLFYNKTLFEQHGWQPPTTMDELLALAEEIQQAGIIPFAHANGDYKGYNEIYAGEFLNHVAGPQNVYDALTQKISWTDPAFVDSINLIKEMGQKGWFMGGMDYYYTTTYDERLQAFADGTAAMNIEGTWVIADYPDHFNENSAINADWGWVPMPSTSGEVVYDLGIGNSYAINSASPYIENAAEFLNYLFLSDTQSILLEKCGNVPGPVPVNKDLLTEQDPRYLEILDELIAQGNNVGYTIYTFWPPKSEAYILDNIENVWADTMTTEDFLAGEQSLFAEEFLEGNVPPVPSR